MTNSDRKIMNMTIPFFLNERHHPRQAMIVTSTDMRVFGDDSELLYGAQGVKKRSFLSVLTRAAMKDGTKLAHLELGFNFAFDSTADHDLNKGLSDLRYLNGKEIKVDFSRHFVGYFEEIATERYGVSKVARALGQIDEDEVASLWKPVVAFPELIPVVFSRLPNLDAAVLPLRTGYQVTTWGAVVRVSRVKELLVTVKPPFGSPDTKFYLADYDGHLIELTSKPPYGTTH